MIKQIPLFLLISIAGLLGACRNSEREKELDKREQAITRREMDFAEKAAEYQQLLRFRDSLMTRQDSVVRQAWPERFAGMWSGKTVCRESDCNDYVVGDQRSDNWEFAGDSSGIFTRIINKDKLLRVYSAEVDSTEVRLRFRTDSTATRKVDIGVVLTPVSNTLMKGTQTIIVNNNCTARFSVELVRPSNP
ncbi:hypothetical protein [Pedobacter sp. JY14-1]|uniref:hypothetical protein n=1 Tax=Pedobacter sp. JY14-1 TaxID=3034151 RepID=UPI0023E11595|nr:hypothetical protein [Pedobacter sp. JY14-1]